MRETLATKPFAVDALGAALSVVAVALLWRIGRNMEWFSETAARFDSQERVTIALGYSAVAATIAGFAGVVVTFGLTSENAHIRQLRHTAGGPLTMNWVSAVSSSFLAAALSAVSAGAFALGSSWLALVLLGCAIFFSLHTAVRVLWLLHTLAGVVSVSDSAAQEAPQEKVEDLFPKSSD